MPASAGKPVVDVDAVGRSRVHPARAGKQARSHRRQLLVTGGSSPRARGRPAGAPITRPIKRVHPRARGAALAAQVGRISIRGSSPRARGSLWRRSAGSASGVHPRARGAALPRTVRVMSGVGSSPRARGSPSPEFPPEFPRGFIPARAGQPARAARSDAGLWVHPRARGAARPSSSCLGAGHAVHLRACGDSSWFLAFGVSSALFCARSEHTAAVARSAVLWGVAPPCCHRLWRDT